MQYFRLGKRPTPRRRTVEFIAARQVECGHDIERGVLLPSMRETVHIHQTVQFDVGAAVRWVWESGAIEKMS